MKAPKRSLFSRPNPTQTAGVVLAGIGLLLFVSVLATFVANLGEPTGLRVHLESILVRIFGGLLLVVLGFAILAVHAHRTSSSAVEFSFDGEEKQPEGDGYTESENMGHVKINPARIGKRKHKKRDEEKLCRFCDSKNESLARFCNQCGDAF